MQYRMKCPRCGSEMDPDPRLTRCPRCGSPLTIRLVGGEPEALRGRGVWRYRGLMPRPLKEMEPVSLGEGGTPLLERRISGVNAWLKLEYLNPLGSFKDRGVSVAATIARGMGYKVLVEDSSGNTGLSTAGYAAAAGMYARIYVPRDAPEGKKRLVRLLGARLVKAPSRSEAARLAEEELGSEEYHVAHTWNPWFIEGTVTVAYEVAEEKGLPDAVVVPVASGTLLLGIHQGFARMEILGMVNDDHPRIIAVQAAGTTPLYERLHGHRPPGHSRLVDALRVPDPPRLAEIAGAIEDTGGDVVVVDDQMVSRAIRSLLSMGLVVEPTSATVFAALEEALEQGLIDKGETVLVPLTGTGFKTLDILAEVVLSNV